ncbi:hypothetical protein WJX84_007709 [Apatococcus fuscideae]|uniref:SUMO-activating enzyme subunit n=1 Tax=Apatococcus fuscideae TaxID=2026836 RepID=A0AAW1TCA7_9CHLO
MTPAVEASGPGWPQVIWSEALQQRVRTAKVLAVGAGGIGCELLKTLALSGFENIEVVDMDTIETSNLNRQFLFRKRHVGQSKAKVAAEAVKRFRPSCNINAMQANIKEPQYNVSWFKGFDLVLNGLDNLEARRHVNRLCLAAEIPLVESGTAAYLGQVSVHIKGKFECFECQPKATPKTFPVCTIRNTPDKPIHCIVWAKDLLFQRLFGRADVVTDLDEAAEKAEEGAEGDAAAAAEQEASFFVRHPEETSEAYAERIFHRVFCFDIERVIGMTDLWKTRKPPVPLKVEALRPAASAAASANGSSHTNGKQAAAMDVSACRSMGLRDSHAAWSSAQSAQVFLKAIQLFLDLRADEVGAAVFDKDDALAVEFVAAASNLRSTCYSIPPLSLFELKGMAGNIVHAIATTNAIVAGLIAVEATKLLAKMPAACRATHLRSSVHTGRSGRERVVGPSMLEPPNPKCPVCGTAQLTLEIDTAKTTFKEFLDKVVRRKLAVSQPTIISDNFMYEEGPDLDEDEVADNAQFLPRPLAALPSGGIKDSSLVKVSDQSQELELMLIVSHQEQWDEEKDPEGFRLGGTAPKGRADAPVAAAAAGPSSSAAAGDDEDDIVEVSEEALEQTKPGLISKRKRATPEEDQPGPGKRLKAAADDVEVLE